MTSPSLRTSSTHAITQGATPHEIPPQRTRQSAREGRKYNPVKPTKKPILKRDGWDKTLARFRTKLDAKFDTLQNVRDGQPSGGLVPEMALAEVDRMMKEDLKRSVSGFLYCVFVIVSLICQPGNSRSGTSQPERESAPGTWRNTWKAYCRQSAQWSRLPLLGAQVRMRVVQQSPPFRDVSILVPPL